MDWKPTPAALALLKKVEERHLAKSAIPIARKLTKEQMHLENRAEENERKYGDQLTYADRMIQSRDECTRNRYDSIEANVGNNGTCTTRRGTYRKLKFGKGNIGKKGFEKLGFKENEGGSS